MIVHSWRNAACPAVLAAAALLAACQGNLGTGSGLPAAPGQGVAPGQAGSGPGAPSRQRVVEGAVYFSPDMAEIPLPSLGSFSVTIALDSAAAAFSSASPGPPKPATSGPLPRLGGAPQGIDPTATATASVARSVPNAGPTASAASPGGAGPSVSGPTASAGPQAAASAPPSGAPSAAPKGGRDASGPSPTPESSGLKIDTKLTVYPEDAPPAPTPAPTGNVQTYLKRVALVRGYLLTRTELTLFGLRAVRFTIPSEELTPNRGFTVAVFDQSKKHHDRLVAFDANAALSGTAIGATSSPSPIALKKGGGYAFLLYGDELAPAAPAASGTYPPAGNNPFVTPAPGGAAPNPYATPTPSNPYATPTPYNPYATPTPYNPYATPTPLAPNVPTFPPSR